MAEPRNKNSKIFNENKVFIAVFGTKFICVNIKRPISPTMTQNDVKINAKEGRGMNYLQHFPSALFWSLNLITVVINSVILSCHSKWLLFVFLGSGGGSSSLIRHVDHPEESDDVANEHTKHWWNEVEVKEHWKGQVSPVRQQDAFVELE